MAPDIDGAMENISTKIGRTTMLRQKVNRYVVENLKNSVTIPHCLTGDLKVTYL
jgi:hypothetical protein